MIFINIIYFNNFYKKLLKLLNLWFISSDYDYLDYDEVNIIYLFYSLILC